MTVCHLYPDLLNLYGDRGNVISFVQRCRWRGLDVQVREINLDNPVKFEEYDFLFIGGGSDREQSLIAADLGARVDSLRAAVEDGLVVLAICGGYQLLGRFYRTPEGKEIAGLGLLDFYTEAGNRRLIGNVAVEAEIGGRKTILVGFENHGGKTFLNGLKPLGRVLFGNGNNGMDGLEGARYKNVFCSYLHGPLLPKNPVLTDYLIALALQRKGIGTELSPLDDSIEERANKAMVKRLLG
ncbi:glutamine amidotransferase [Desulfallas sp. Bu1-1]|uniref:type 1 glutamine amidotransferase n=1 Tax=Desulfallas sp. Bu1-1 TaxID=2787620 RepID=UPI00189DD49D|nr:glutamine amidotransferase [Desulfallas sp. Bu1-1]MBF7083536.1 glutamine amidotransferase [Desulfallas sp. Bu1-1]